MLMFVLTGCYTYVEPGYEAMKVYVAGSNVGQEEHLPAGRYFSTYRTEYYPFPVFEQTAQFRDDEAFEFTVEGLKVGMEVGLSYTITDVPVIFKRYRAGVDEITNTHLRNIIRDALNQETRVMNMEGIYGENANDMMVRVIESVNDKVQPVGISVTGIYMIGRPQFPHQVEQAIERRINATQTAEQREIERREAIAQSEIDRERARGEADAKVIQAKGEAEANKIINQSISPILVQWKSLDVWDGKLPTVTSDATPFINMNQNN